MNTLTTIYGKGFNGRFVVSVSILLLLICSMTPAVQAKELKPGFVINKNNLNEVLDDTFQGHKVDEMLLDTQKRWIKNYNLRIQLDYSQQRLWDKRYLEATKRNHEGVTYNPEDRSISGFESGVPFPNLTPDDPHAGDKLAYNKVFGANWENSFNYYMFRFLWLDPEEGLEKTQSWTFQRYFMRGRLGDGPATLGNGDILWKEMLFATQPRDIAGLGTFRIRYTTGRTDDAWAYIQSIRRTRRIPGRIWWDNIGGTDEWLSEPLGLDVHPTWFKKFEIVDHRIMLSPTQRTFDGLKKAEQMGMANAPYYQIDWKNEEAKFNPAPGPIVFVPREVYVLKGTPPQQHPAGHKLVYIDRATWKPVWGEVFDKSGEFWKIHFHPAKVQKTQTNNTAYLPTGHFNYDFKRRHSTVAVAWSDRAYYDQQNITHQDFNVSKLSSGEPVRGPDKAPPEFEGGKAPMVRQDPEIRDEWVGWKILGEMNQE